MSTSTIDLWSSSSFRSISFPSVKESATFLQRAAHAFADDKETRIAELLRPVAQAAPRLPALAAPSLAPAEPCCLVISWTPLQLAAHYVVELRPAVAEAEWTPVDLGGEGHFAHSCSSCKVSGLRPGPYEARVIYISSCGCRSEAPRVLELYHRKVRSVDESFLYIDLRVKL